LFKLSFHNNCEFNHYNTIVLFLDGNEYRDDPLPDMVAECIYTGNAILSFYQDILNTVHCENDVKLVRTL